MRYALFERRIEVEGPASNAKHRLEGDRDGTALALPPGTGCERDDLGADIGNGLLYNLFDGKRIDFLAIRGNLRVALAPMTDIGMKNVAGLQVRQRILVLLLEGSLDRLGSRGDSQRLATAELSLRHACTGHIEIRCAASNIDDSSVHILL